MRCIVIRMLFVLLIPLLLSAVNLLVCANEISLPTDQNDSQIKESVEIKIWSFQGQIEISNGQRHAHGNLIWQQNERQYIVEFFPPLTRQNLQLFGDTHYEGGTIIGPEIGTIDDENAEALLDTVTGLEIPVNYLPDWTRGSAVWDTSEPAQINDDSNGLVVSIKQLGWTIRYLEWHLPNNNGLVLPKILELNNGLTKIRLVINHWSYLNPTTILIA